MVSVKTLDRALPHTPPLIPARTEDFRFRMDVDDDFAWRDCVACLPIRNGTAYTATGCQNVLVHECDYSFHSFDQQLSSGERVLSTAGKEGEGSLFNEKSRMDSSAFRYPDNLNRIKIIVN